MLKNLSLLFGSGISIGARMPSVCTITERVMSGTEVMRHTNGSYAFGQALYAQYGIPDEYVPRVVEFLKILSKEIEGYYYPEQDGPEHKSKVNYEQLYYVAAQIRDSETKEYDNPIIPAFIEKIMSEIKPLLLGRMTWNIHKISEEATHYIHDIVWHFLRNTEPANLDYLHCLKDACQDEKVSKLNFFTLNHDTVVEQYLDDCRIKYSDGFGQPINDIRYWSPEVYKDSSNKVRLYKLHGSVDWFRFNPHIGSSSNNPLIGIPLNGDHWHSNNQENQLQDPIDGRPMLLAGTFNKMLQYTSGIYADLYCQMYSALQETETFIVCGYGFGDKGINSRLIEWLNSSKQHRMVVIHAEPEKLQKGARGAISKNWNNWLENKKLVLVQKWIECVSWEEVLSALGA